MLNHPDRIGGIVVIENAALTVPGEPYEVPRGWWERLFTRPWRPLDKKRWVTPRKPDPNFYRMGDRLVGHPMAIANLKRCLREKNTIGGICDPGA